MIVVVSVVDLHEEFGDFLGSFLIAERGLKVEVNGHDQAVYLCK